jgi:hypothetical protein
MVRLMVSAFLSGDDFSFSQMFIYNIMQTQCEHLNKDINFSMKLIIFLFIIFIS